MSTTSTCKAFLLALLALSIPSSVLSRHKKDDDYCEYRRNRRLEQVRAYQESSSNSEFDRNPTNNDIGDKEPIYDGNINTAVSLWQSDQALALQRFGHISLWDTSGVTFMRLLFRDAADFNDDIGDWDTSCVETMYGMFWGATAFNQDISSWRVERVTTMYSMFRDARSFNQDLPWNAYQNEEMGYMFAGATQFRGNLELFDTSHVYSMQGTFSNMNYNGNIRNWDVSSVVKTTEMFEQNQIFNQDLDHWNTYSLLQYSRMFYNATSFRQKVCWDLREDPPIRSFQVFCFTNSSRFDQDCVDDEMIRDDSTSRCEDALDSYIGSFTDFFADVADFFVGIGDFFVGIFEFFRDLFTGNLLGQNVSDS